MIHPQNIGVAMCTSCQHKRRVLRMGMAQMCSTCTRALVAGWAILGRMYEPVQHELVSEAQHELGVADETEGA